MMEYIVTRMICTTFERDVGRWQSKNEKQTAMQVSFSLRNDYDKEEGYRYIDVLIFGPMNYVGVLVRERWNIIPLTDLDAEKECLKPGYDYREGDTGWISVGYHDSCWREGVKEVIWENRDRINGLDSMANWYTKVEMTPALISEFERAISDRKIYKVGEGVLQFP